MKTKLILAGLLTLSIFFTVSIYDSYKEEKTARKKAERNTEILAHGMDSITTLNGELAIRVGALEVSGSSLEKLNSELHGELKNLRTKLKNVQSATQIVEVVRVVNDTMLIADANGVFRINETDLKGSITVKGGTIPKGGIALELPNTMYMSVETVYKGWWIFRKRNGVNVTLRNTNKYYNIDGIYHYELGR